MLHILTILDLRLALDDLFERRIGALRATGVGRSYEPRLAWYHGQLLQIAEPADRTRPLADRLALTSSAHHALGSAIFHLMEAYLRVPGRSDEQRQTILRLRRVFMPRLGELQDSYQTQAARAATRQSQVATHLVALSAIPVQGDQTLAHWVRSFIEQGCMLDALLTCRADVSANAAACSSERVEAGSFRGTLVGVLNRMRAAIADELASEPTRLRQLDAELFAYIDQLAKTRATAHRVRTHRAELEPTPPQLSGEGVIPQKTAA